LEKRSLFDRLVGRYNSTSKDYTKFQMMNGYTPEFTSFGDDAYSSDIVRATINSIATNCAKLTPKHIRRMHDSVERVNSKIQYLLSVRPNAYMSAYDFYYKVVSQLYTKNNSFILIQTEGFDVVGFYPIQSSQVELLEANNEMYARFRFMNGKMLTVPYSQVIHLRRFFNENDMYGESNTQALMPTLKLLHTMSEGIINAIKSSAFLRGLLKFTQAMLRPEDIKKQTDQFVADYMSISNSGGVAGLDAKADYIELKSNPVLVSGEQMSIVEEKVFKYFNVNKKIVMSDYTESEFDAFYESVIEPIAIQLSLEFTSKLFTDRERGFGNEIIYESNRLAYQSTKTKIELVNTLMPLGLISINEAREIFNLVPVDGGEKRLVSLNYVDADKQNEYQVGADANEGNQNVTNNSDES
jgi:HK97 family phage portal protein